MTLSPGDRLNHWEISGHLGAGGMGEVYRARDARLGREVAVKVLSDELTQDADRLARFEREAKTLAVLNHTNIATLYGLERTEDAGGIPFLVLELVDGEELAGRIARGPLPIREALELARQIAEGLGAAHDKGLVHRDLKPANVKVSTEGVVKILDFGLAKAIQPPSVEVGLDQAETIDAGLTRVGTVLGTLPYMCPEQAVGRAVDRRSDLWSFGCVVFEMLTGTRAFPGSTQKEVLAHLLERDPDWSLLPANLPPEVTRVMRRCLERDANRRCRDAGDLALLLEDVLRGRTESISEAGSPQRSRSGFVPWLVAAAGVILAVGAWFAGPEDPELDMPRPVRFSQPSPGTLDLARIGHYGPALALSPDGRTLVWVAVREESTHLFRRHLGENEVAEIEGSEGALAPFFSPDGSWIGFWSNLAIKKVPTSGGVPQTLFEFRHPHGADWGDGQIVLGGIGDGSTWRFDLESGALSKIATPPGYKSGFPKLLPGSRHALVTSEGNASVDLLSLDDGQVRTLVTEGAAARYLDPGYLVWAQGNHLLAARFDLGRLDLNGESRTILEGVSTESDIELGAHFALSATGTLAYIPDTAPASAMRLAWVDLEGRVTPLAVKSEANFLSLRVSPDGKSILTSHKNKTRQIWITDLERGVEKPLTDDEGDQFWGIFTNDGSRLIYNSGTQSGQFNLWIRPLDGSAPPRQLTDDLRITLPQDVTNDDRLLLFTSTTEIGAGFDVEMVDLAEGAPPEPLLTGPDDEIHPTLSPDDRWLAFASDRTGEMEVYVQPFEGPGSAERVSRNGGEEPIWSPRGDRLYYRSVNGRRIYGVDVGQGERLELGEEEELFEGNFRSGVRWSRLWDIDPSGDRFLILHAETAENPGELRVVVDWRAELEARF